MGGNTGFAAAANAGAAAASRELLLLLNPGGRPLPGYRDAIERPWLDRRGAWMGLVVTEGGEAVRLDSSQRLAVVSGPGKAGEVDGVDRSRLLQAFELGAVQTGSSIGS